MADFSKAHWGLIAGADFFTTEVWTWQDLVTYYTVFVIDLASRRVQVLGSTPHPSEVFMGQMVRLATAADTAYSPAIGCSSVIAIENGAARCYNSSVMLASVWR